MEHILQFIGKAIFTASLFVVGLFGGTAQAPTQNLGATIPIPVAVFQTSLQTGISNSDTSMTLVSGTDKSGDNIAGYICFNIDEGTAKEEFVCGTASGTSVTSMIRGIDPVDGDLEVTALKKAHGRGASVKVTNYPSLGILSRILNGNETIPNPISYETGIGPISSNDLADKEYVLSVVSGGTVSFEKLVVSGNAGETVSAGNILYLNSADNEWYKTDADASATSENVILGVAQGAGTNGNAITGGILIRGIDSNQSGLTPNTIYYISNTAGGVSSSAGTKEVTIGIAQTSSSMIFAPRFNQDLTEDEMDALAGGGAYGTPSSSNKFITQDYNKSSTGLPTVQTLTTVSTEIGDNTTQFDITNPAGSTFRYTWDSTGTDPTISLANNPIGSLINIKSNNIHADNQGVFVLTGAGTNYFEVTNASGVVESNKTIGTGYMVESGTSVWTKPANLKYIVVETQAGGGGGDGTGVDEDNGKAGGGGGGYSKKLIQASSLGATEYYLVGDGGTGGASPDDGFEGRISQFGIHLYATGGAGGGPTEGGAGGEGFGGDVNITGSGGGGEQSAQKSGAGGSSHLGGGAPERVGDDAGVAGGNYGGGGSGAAQNGSDPAHNGGDGAQGIIIITEYYS